MSAMSIDMAGTEWLRLPWRWDFCLAATLTFVCGSCTRPDKNGDNAEAPPVIPHTEERPDDKREDPTTSQIPASTNGGDAQALANQEDLHLLLTVGRSPERTRLVILRQEEDHWKSSEAASSRAGSRVGAGADLIIGPRGRAEVLFSAQQQLELERPRLALLRTRAAEGDPEVLWTWTWPQAGLLLGDFAGAADVMLMTLLGRDGSNSLAILKPEAHSEPRIIVATQGGDLQADAVSGPDGSLDLVYAHAVRLEYIQFAADGAERMRLGIGDASDCRAIPHVVAVRERSGALAVFYACTLEASNSRAAACELRSVRGQDGRFAQGPTVVTASRHACGMLRSDRPAVAVAPDGSSHILFRARGVRASNQSEIGYVLGDGATFSAPHYFSEEGAAFPRIAVAPNGTVLVAFLYGGEVLLYLGKDFASFSRSVVPMKLQSGESVFALSGLDLRRRLGDSR